MFFARIKTLQGEAMKTQLLVKADTSWEVLQRCQTYITQLETKMSAYLAESEVVAVNKAAGKNSVNVSKELLETIEIALEVAAKTKGAFDPTIGALTHLAYGFGFAHEHLPSDALKRKARQKVDYTKVEVKEGCIFLKERGMALDLGGVAKGYIAHLARRFLERQGAKSVLVSIGGEISCIGKAWKIGIQHPSQARLYGYIVTHKEAFCISTSGSYARFIGSQEHHHILDHTTASSRQLQGSLTLISKEADLGQLDALNTALFGSGLDITALQTRYRFETLALSTLGEEKMSEGFTSLIKRFKRV